MFLINESSLTDLYKSAVIAFPNTKKRQHVKDSIVIEELRYTPFLGVKTLFIRAEAKNEERHYSPMILIKGVNYGKHGAKIIDNDNKIYEFEKISIEENNVNVRCNCADFFWRFNYYDHLDQSLYGNKRKKYKSKNGKPANPLKMPGMCKHLMKAIEAIKENGIFN